MGEIKWVNPFMFWIHQIRDVLIFYCTLIEMSFQFWSLKSIFLLSLLSLQMCLCVHQQFKGVLESLLVARHNKWLPEQLTGTETNSDSVLRSFGVYFSYFQRSSIGSFGMRTGLCNKLILSFVVYSFIPEGWYFLLNFVVKKQKTNIKKLLVILKMSSICMRSALLLC